MRTTVLLLTALVFLTGCGKPNQPLWPEPGSEATMIYQTRLNAEPLDMVKDGTNFYVLQKDKTILIFYQDGYGSGLIFQDRYFLESDNTVKTMSVVPQTNIYGICMTDFIRFYDTRSGKNLWQFGSSGIQAMACNNRTAPVISQWHGRLDTVRVTQLVFADMGDGLSQRFFYPDSTELPDSSVYITYSDQPVFTGIHINQQTPIFLYYPLPQFPWIIEASFGESGLGILQLDQNPPTIIDWKNTGGNCSRVSVDTLDNSKMLVAEEWQATLMGVSPLGLDQICQFKPSGFDNIIDVAIWHNKIAILDRLDGIQFYDIANLNNPLEKERYKIRTGVRIIFDDAGNLICLSESEGLIILQPSF